jgi:hypothetical protein
MTSHPEQSKPQLDCTDNDWGIHMADAIAGTSDHVPEDGTFPIFHCNAEDIYAALIPRGTWTWEDEAAVFHGSLRQHAQYPEKRYKVHLCE